MRTIRMSSACVLAAAGLCLGGTAADPLQAAHARLERAFGVAGFYGPPEFPKGCLDWAGKVQGDSVLFVPKLARTAVCKGIVPVAERWMMPVRGGLPRLVDGKDGKGRIEFAQLIGLPMSGDAVAKLLETVSRDAESDPEEAASREEEGNALLDGGDGGRDVGTRRSAREEPQEAREPSRALEVELEGRGADARPRESILRVVRAHQGGFRYTFEKFRRNNPALAGKISLKFTISPVGDIVAIKVASSSTGSSSLDEEILAKARRMKFDPIEKGSVLVTCGIALDRL